MWFGRFEAAIDAGRQIAFSPVTKRDRTPKPESDPSEALPITAEPRKITATEHQAVACGKFDEAILDSYCRFWV